MIESYKKLGTPAISDALDSLGISGGLLGILPRSGPKMVGYAFTVKYELIQEPTGSFQAAGDYIDLVQPGEIIVIDNNGFDFATTWGGILTEFAQMKKIAGTVIHGAARDLERVQQLSYPLHSTHIFMQSGKNRVRKISHQESIKIHNNHVQPGDLICADASGCVVVPKDKMSEILERAEAVERTEAKIIKEIALGMKLSDARKKFGYSEPWKSHAK